MLRSFAIFVFVQLLLLQAAAAAAAGGQVQNTSTDANGTIATTNDGARRRTLDALPGPWLADMFYRALANFTVRTASSPDCQKHTQMYTQHLKNNSYWAVKMYDSWSRYPNGILAGSTHQMGVFDECIGVHKPIQGKYCMSAIKLSTSEGRAFDLDVKDEMENHDNAWNEVLGFVDYDDRYRRDEVKIGICIPESCSAEDLETSLQDELDNVFLPHGVQPRVKVEPILCSTDKHMYPYDNGYYFTRALIYSLFVICCLSTFVHLIKITRDTDKVIKCNLPEYVYWFSVIHNGRSLIKYDKNNELNIFNGFKSMFMVFTLFAHKFLYYSMRPMSYAVNMEKLYKVGPDFMLTGMNVVDPFFYVTGFLMYVMIKQHFLKRGTHLIQIPMIIIYKYLRMLPAYGAMMLLVTYSIPYLYSGPFWSARMWPEADRCKNYWWANILIISNFIEVDNQCMIVGWYISCLFQFLLIGTVLIYVCVKNRKVGVSLISVSLFISLVVPFVLTYITQTYGLVRITLSFLENPSSSYEFRNFYRPFYTRGTPFFIGLLAGIAVEEMKSKEIKMSKIVVYVWTFIIITVSIWVQNYAAVFYERHRPYNVFEQALYSTLSHCTLAVSLFWITLCYYSSGYGPIERIFNNRFATIFGRLSFVVYLVNIPVMMIIESRQSTPVSPTEELWIDSWIVGTVRSYIAALVLYLAVEGPFNIIIKRLFYGNPNSTRKEKSKGLEEQRAPVAEIQQPNNLRL